MEITNMARAIGRTIRHFFFTKVLRQRGTPEYVARGVALGLLVGWVVPMGLQFAIVIPLAFLLKAAKIPAMVFTFVSNHFTVFFLYPMQCYVGSRLLGYDFSLESIRESVMRIAQPDTSFQESIHLVLQMGRELGGSFVVGGLIFGIPSAVIGYFLAIWAVRRYRRFREMRMQKRQLLQHQKAAEASAPHAGEK